MATKTKTKVRSAAAVRASFLKKQRKQYKPKTAREMFVTLRRFFETAHENETDAVWGVLTALRGPDHDENRGPEKRATTAVIRRKLLGVRVFWRNCLIGLDHNPDCEEHRQFRCQREFKSGHFGNHARKAFRLLGLKWDGVNPE